MPDDPYALNNKERDEYIATLDEESTNLATTLHMVVGDERFTAILNEASDASEALDDLSGAKASRDVWRDHARSEGITSE